MSGISFDANTVFDANKVSRDFNEGLNKAQAALDSAVLSDSNYFVPLKTGTLQKSAIINTRIGSGEVTWQTPYARRLYYEYEKPAHQANPNACAKWFEAAKSRWLKKWIGIVNEYVKRS